MMVEVPLLTPRLSSHWVRLLTGADWAVARELVVGLKTDLLARDARYWPLIDHPTLVPFEAAARTALAAEWINNSWRNLMFAALFSPD